MPVRRAERQRRTRRLERVGVEKRTTVKARIREHIKRVLGEEAARKFEQIYARILGSYAVAKRWLRYYHKRIEDRLRRLSEARTVEERMKIYEELEELLEKARRHAHVIAFYEGLTRLAIEEFIAADVIKEIYDLVDALSKATGYPLSSVLERWYYSRGKIEFLTPDNIDQFYFDILAERYYYIQVIVELMPGAPLYNGETEYFTVKSIYPGDYDRVELADGLRRAIKEAPYQGWDEALRRHFPRLYHEITEFLSRRGYSWGDVASLIIKIKLR